MVALLFVIPANEPESPALAERLLSLVEKGIPDQVGDDKRGAGMTGMGSRA